MIVVAGGTGLLGRDLVSRLAGRGLEVRVVTRDPDRARAGWRDLPSEVQLVRGDVRDPASLGPVLAGAETVVAAVQGFGGRDAGGVGPVDRDGNVHLIQAAARSGAHHLVLLSIRGASPDSPLSLGRAKSVAEAALATSGLRGTVIRPTAYMETWGGLIGGSIIATGRARVFGRGLNPINFVAARDVAPIVEAAVVAPDGQPATIDVVGPEDLTMLDLVAAFGRALGRDVPVSHVPRPMMRVLSTVFRPLRPVIADQIAAGLALDSVDLRAAGRGTVTGRTRFDEIAAAFVADARPSLTPQAG